MNESGLFGAQCATSKKVVALKRNRASMCVVSNAANGETNMGKLAAIIIDTFTMGTLTGDVFVELQTIFQNAAADMGATKIEHIGNRALCVLVDRGFVTAHYNYENRFVGYVPSDKARDCMHLELANGWRCSEPRDAYDARLVVDRPEWIEPACALGVSVNP